MVSRSVYKALCWFSCAATLGGFCVYAYYRVFLFDFQSGCDCRTGWSGKCYFILGASWLIGFIHFLAPVIGLLGILAVRFLHRQLFIEERLAAALGLASLAFVRMFSVSVVDMELPAAYLLKPYGLSILIGLFSWWLLGSMGKRQVS
jgi:hypothetical protein